MQHTSQRIRPYRSCSALTTITLRSRLAGMLGAIAFLAVTAGAAAQGTYPDRPVRVIVPYAAGAYTDATTRIVMGKVSELIGQPVVVEARAGANTVIGTEVVAKSRPDGYTLLVVSTAFSVLPALIAKLPFDTKKDFAPVGMMTSTQLVLVTGVKSQFRSVQDVIAYAKANPGKLTMATAGSGTLSHLVSESMKRQINADFIIASYKGGAPALTDLMGGHVDVFFDTLTTASSNVLAGTVRPLAITGKERHPALPDVPTMGEGGLSGFTALVWSGLLAPAGTPGPVISTLSSALDRAVQTSDVKAALAKLGTDGEGGGPARFGTWLAQEQDKWTRLVKEANIKAD